ncbi:hypothetical protein C1A50_0765 [Paenibacillus polymyxa]|nr:hypothetical protein C1A50_0765 [Paenibacillus polymyxa]
MDTGSFRFQFRDPQQAAQACETLKEIGYSASTNGDTGLSVHVENQDVLSALEICQAYEGSIIETGARRIKAALPKRLRTQHRNTTSALINNRKTMWTVFQVASIPK